MLPVPRLSRLEIPKTSLIALVVTGFWVWGRRRDLIFPWLLALSGIALLNHQVITGREMQNFHYRMAYNPMIMLVVLALVAEKLNRVLDRGGLAAVVLALVVALHYSAGVVIRRAEATRSISVAQTMNSYVEFKRQTGSAGAPLMARGAMVAGDLRFLEMAVLLTRVRPLDGYNVYISPYIADPELDSRTALNAYLLGLDRSEFARRQRTYLEDGMGYGWGPWVTDRHVLEEKLSRQLAAFDAVSENLKSSLDRFQVRYLALPSGDRLRDDDPGWTLLQEGPTWDIWERGGHLLHGRAAPRRAGAEMALRQHHRTGVR